MKIEVEPPTSDARRERVERRVFDQLAAVRVIERTDAVIPVDPPSRRWVLPAGLFAAAAAVLVAFVVMRGGNEAPVTQAQVQQSRVVTPVGATSRFSIGEDAVIDAASDTSVEVQNVPGGGITLVLARGSVDCDVAPRAGRAPFRVISGDVSVEVVGTRFTVTRTPTARVDVTRGKVKVFAPGGSWLVSAGESWTPASTAQTAAIEPPKAPEVAAEAPAPAPAAPKAKKLDPAVAFDQIDSAKDPIAAADAFLKAYPHHALVEDVTYKRVEALVKAGRNDEARRAAADYLKKYPHGTYVEVASRVAAQK
jgi:hypothetical protein